VGRASGLVLILTGLGAATYVPASMDTNPVAPHSQPHAESAAVPAEPSPVLPVPVVVTVVRRRVEPPVAPEPRPATPRDREAIGRQLQKELKRVGCYEGQLHGVWTTSTRQAMQTFIDRVNARLPTAEPDAILLALVQGYHEKICGKLCPAGQGPGETGRCLPYAMLARTSGAKDAPAAAVTLARGPMPDIKGGTTTEGEAAPAQPIETAPTEGHMALADPAPPRAAAAPPRRATPHAVTERRRSRYAEREAGWARNLFRLQDRFGTN